MLVRYGCGCIGFPKEKARTVLVKSCNCSEVEMIIKPHNYILENYLPGVPLDKKEEEAIFNEMDALIADGKKFRELKSILTLDGR